MHWSKNIQVALTEQGVRLTDWPDGISWTLNLLIIGVIIGCINAWFWVKRERWRG